MINRVQIEDAVKHIYQCAYRGEPATRDSMAGALSFSREKMDALIHQLQSEKLAVMQTGGLCLTERGEKEAVRLIRAHRLYETHLARETGVTETDWHQQAELAEHRLSEEELKHLDDRLGHPKFDPHGDPIPTREGELPPLRGESLWEQGEGWEGRIIHVEDEPEGVYSKIVARGIAPGSKIRVERVTDFIFQIRHEGRSLPIDRAMAANLTVAPFSEGDGLDDSVQRLSVLCSGEKATVVKLSAACRGQERARLLDMGIVPGSVIEPAFSGLFQSPVAYRIKDSVLALRTEQADHVLVRKIA